MVDKFEALYDTFYDSVYRYIYANVRNKWDTEDIISTVFTNIYKNKDKIVDIDKSKSWVFTIAHNCIIDFYRKNGHVSNVISIEDLIDHGSNDTGFEEILIRDEVERVRKYFNFLPKEYQDYIYMRFYGNLKFREIAEATNNTEGAVKSAVFRSIDKVKRMYNESIGGKTNAKR